MMGRIWNNIKKLLVIRADNMGDLLMSTPAIRALKESFGCHITILTSSMAAAVSSLIPEIDETIICNLPWVKSPDQGLPETFFGTVELLKQKGFDACVIFTVYSQNPMPAVMLAYAAGIPKRLAYCRENPYLLLTDWAPDKEPYERIYHQVKRDLLLVKQIGAETTNTNLSVRISNNAWQNCLKKLNDAGFNKDKPWVIFHAGVSEEKRKYPDKLWAESARLLIKETGLQILLTGAVSEKELTDKLQREIGPSSFSAAGLLSVEEFAALISYAPVLVSVNTGSIHLAAAVDTPVVVLYALTNPQHLPWNTTGKALPFSVLESLKSSNRVIRFVDETHFKKHYNMPGPAEVVAAIKEVLSGRAGKFPELINELD